MIKRQISFLFEDPGFCIDVFCTIAEPVRYYNRDTESGAWYSSTPDWNENGSLIREDLIFEVIADGVVCALDGNGNFEGKKPFVPFCQFRQSLVQSVHTLQLVAIPVIPILEATLLAVGACLMATAIPLRKISKMSIVDSIETVE